MQDSDELARWINRLAKRKADTEHSVRRLKAVIDQAEKIGILDTLRQWIFGELYRIEGQHNDVNEAIDKLADRVSKHL